MPALLNCAGKGRGESLALHAVFQRRPWRSCLVMPHNTDSVLFEILSYPGMPSLCLAYYLFMIHRLMRRLRACVNNVYQTLGSTASVSEVCPNPLTLVACMISHQHQCYECGLPQGDDERPFTAATPSGSEVCLQPQEGTWSEVKGQGECQQ